MLELINIFHKILTEDMFTVEQKGLLNTHREIKPRSGFAQPNFIRNCNMKVAYTSVSNRIIPFIFFRNYG
jgi:hypothetical protein